VIGGGVSEAGELLLDPARAAFERALPGRGHRPLAEIKVAQLGEDAGIVGAADLARENGQNAAFTRRRRRRRPRLGRPVLARSYAARVWRSL
jgi:glucokinase